MPTNTAMPSNNAMPIFLTSYETEMYIFQDVEKGNLVSW